MSNDDDDDDVLVGPPFGPDYARERDDEAFRSLREILEEKDRGDRITNREIRDATGFDDVARRLGSRIKRFFSERGMVAVPVPHDGWRVLTADEQTDEAIRRSGRARRQNARGFHAVSTTPRTQLSDANVRRADFVERLLRRSCEQDEMHRKELKRELGIGSRGDRVPLLNKKSGDSK